jgi:hypothetical protein
MSEVFGDFVDSFPMSQVYLRIQFLPGSMPRQRWWRNNGLSANFMADFLLNFFPNEHHAMDVAYPPKQIQGTICYVANELLENAMKFTEDTSQYPISLTLYLLSDRLVLISTNSVTIQAKNKLKAFIHRLIHSNLNQLYIEQLEKSALDESYTSAGLGILTILNDYAAAIGWKLENNTHNGSDEECIVMTMVQLTI